MKIPGLGTTSYPASGATSHSVLFSSLGSFWTRVFGDREALRGLTIGQSEELIQRYYEFVESLNALSVKQIDPLKKDRWLPIRIRKSQLRLAPLKFLPSGHPDQAKFGPQPLPETPAETNNNYHYGETFRFGRAKRPVEHRYTAPLDKTIKRIPVLADRIVGPQKVLTAGVDFWIEGQQLYFTENPFDSEEFLKYDLFDDSGQPLTFKWESEITPYFGPEFESDLGPTPGTVINEEEIILWAYHAQVDTNNLYDNFGVLLDVKEEDPEVYKHILRQTVHLLTEGPTVQAVCALAGSFLGVPHVESAEETLVDAYSVDTTWYVITDKRVYKAPTYFNLSSQVYHTDVNPALQGPKVGAKLPAGTPLFDAVTYYDNVSTPGWWNSALTRIVLPGSMFIGDYDGALIFENIQSFVDRGDDNKLRYSPDIVSTEPGRLLFPFPPTVSQADQDTFNDYISDESRYDTVRTLIQASLNVAGKLDPLDYVFKNFLKTNTAMLRIRFQTIEQAAKFAKVFHLIKSCLPMYVYVLFDFDLTMPQDTVRFAKNSTSVDKLCADGSDMTGWVKVPPYDYAPWEIRFGWPTITTELVRPFVISKLIDLVNTYTNGYGTFYQYTDGYSGTNDIPYDTIDFSNKYTSGTDASNIPLTYLKPGEITVVQDGLVVTGSGTKFTADISVGDFIYDLGEYRAVAEITSDTSLKISSAFSGSTRTVPLYVAHDKPSTRNLSGLIFWRM